MTGDEKQTLTRIICGAIKSQINEHGPIQRRQIFSAAKRIAGQVAGWIDKRASEESEITED